MLARAIIHRMDTTEQPSLPLNRSIVKCALPVDNFSVIEFNDPTEFLIWSYAHRDHLRDEKKRTMRFTSRYRANLHIACISS